MLQKISRLLRDPRFWLGLIIVFAAGVRLYRLPEYMLFLGDQGRDALVVKRMIVDGKWTLLGPTASVGGFYTGPIYYYFMLPFLFIFNLNPAGPAFMSALFGIGAIILIYIFCNRIFGWRVGIIAAFLMTISSKMIDISRFSWNPNPIPFFVLAMILSIYNAAKTSKYIWTAISGICLGVLVQLHYTDISLIPVMGILLIILFPKKKIIPQILVFALGVFIGILPFFAFEVRHGFPNTKSVIEFMTRKNGAISFSKFNPTWQIYEATRRLFEATSGISNDFQKLFYFPSLLGFAWWVVKKYKSSSLGIKIIVVWFAIGIMAISTYRSFLTEHYFSYLFPIPFITIAVTATILLQKKLSWPIFIIWIGIFSYFQIKNAYIWHKPNNFVGISKEVAMDVVTLSSGKPYNFALGSLGNSDHAYRYFLEISNHEPITIENPQIDPERKTVTDQLIVVCEQKDCTLLGSPLWEIAGFGQAQLSNTVVGPAGVYIYRLTHYRAEMPSKADALFKK